MDNKTPSSLCQPGGEYNRPQMAEQEIPQKALEVVQAVFGTYHHFDLARELYSRGYLKAIWSTFPWRRLQREGIPRDRVHTFPWIHTPQFILQRRRMIPAGLNWEISWQAGRTFDRWVTRHMPACDAYVAISGAGEASGPRAQSLGAKYICDRGSAHLRYTEKVLSEEHRHWGLPGTITPERFIAREEIEYAQADAITVPSEFARRSFVEMGVAPEKLHKIPYGVRLDRFRPVAEPAKDCFEVLFVGSVSLRKGFPYLLQAFAQLRHPHKRLRIVGGLSREIGRILPRLPQENVEFVGHISQEQLPAVMSSSHVMVLASIEEGLALVQAQALACGCPLICSTNSGGEDLITDGVEGFVVPIRSPEAIAARLQRLADDTALRQRMSEAALACVRHIGGWHEYGERWTELLGRMVQPRTYSQSPAMPDTVRAQP
jgi:glycosyltransferase involved in cell wall biosynthesis